MKLLSPASSNTKLRKSQGAGYRLVSLSLAPADSADPNRTVCAQASNGCKNVCVGSHTGLVTIFKSIMESRVKRTLFFLDHPEAFMKMLRDELRHEQAIAERLGEYLICRPNCFSDISWESQRYHLPQDFPDVTFFDYTKVHGRIGKQPANYTLCGSWSEEPKHQRACIDILENGRGTVAVPFANVGKYVSRLAYTQVLPRMHRLPGAPRSYSVLDGDANDVRSFDRILTPSGFGRIVGLRLKSANNADREAAIKSGFVEIV